jgi:hypothetical protein
MRRTFVRFTTISDALEYSVRSIFAKVSLVVLACASLLIGIELGALFFSVLQSR